MSPAKETAMQETIFHLAFPVRNLQEAKKFYVETLGARVGRQKTAWIDIMLYGAQITLHEKPEQVLSDEKNGVRHFGATLPWTRWQAVADSLRARAVSFRMPPTISHHGTPDEQAKLMISDPSGNLIELKCYRNPAVALALDDAEQYPQPAA
jgi:hypothetical protein